MEIATLLTFNGAVNRHQPIITRYVELGLPVGAENICEVLLHGLLKSQARLDASLTSLA